MASNQDSHILCSFHPVAVPSCSAVGSSSKPLKTTKLTPDQTKENFNQYLKTVDGLPDPAPHQVPLPLPDVEHEVEELPADTVEEMHTDSDTAKIMPAVALDYCRPKWGRKRKRKGAKRSQMKKRKKR